MAVRPRYAINTHLEDQGITMPAAIGVAVGAAGASGARCDAAAAGSAQWVTVGVVALA